MPVQEPPSDLDLWPRVKALSSWPDTNEDVVRALSGGWQRAGDAFRTAAEFNVGAIPATWADSAGTAMVGSTERVLASARQNVQGMQGLAGQAAGFADAVVQTKTAIGNLIQDNLQAYAGLSGLPAGAQEAFQASFVTTLANAVNAYTAAMAEQVSANTLVLAARAAAGPVAGPVAGPPPGASPDQVKAWWDKLSQQDQATILRDSPDLIRGLDGIPAAIRDSANRAWLQQTTADLTAQRDQLAAKVAKDDHTARRADPADKIRLRELNDKLGGLQAIQNRLDSTKAGQPPAFLLKLDPTGDGKAVVAIGNPDTAANVVTSVPGTGASLGGIGGDLNRSDRLWQSSQLAGSPSTAVVAWLGYDAPDSLLDATSESYADGGEKALQDFQNGLRATHQGAPSQNTVLGHSYGTTAVGHAARDGSLDADRLVFVASPGVGAEHATDLHLDGVDQAVVPQRVYSTVAQNDFINEVNHGLPFTDILGPDPADPDFGGRTFDSPPGEDGPLGLDLDAHSAYFDDGSEPGKPRNPALDAMGDIIAGKR
ncbi:hypothetical protein GCM10009744_33580 [Kribbella alba]|uniref:Alpha/beta hydrolase n=1 Tax=Kribbella alba TaxID=190197 RepID=A0ABN2FEH9_9ACTN